MSPRAGALGPGLATKAARAITAHGLATLDVDRLIALIDEGNEASLRIAEKLDMTVEGDVEEGSELFPLYSVTRQRWFDGHMADESHSTQADSILRAMRHPPGPSSSSRRRAAITVAVVLALSLVPIAAPGGEAAPPDLTYAFGPTGIEGGGFQNVVVADPSGSGVVLAGGDVSGISRSTDFGRTWMPSNTGATGLSWRSIAAIAFSPTDPGTVYAGFGYRGRRGGLLVSEDAGVSWSVRSLTPQFSGASNAGVKGVPSSHPRSTGSLLAIDAASGLMYAATFADGVLRSADDGRTWTLLGAAGTKLRSIAIDPSDPDHVIAATYGQGAWQTLDATGDGAFTRIAAAPAQVEELAYVSGQLYAAAGANGLYTVSADGATWTQLGQTTLPATGPKWTAIEGVEGCGGTTLFAGAHTGSLWSVARSVDSGETWTSLSGSTLSTTIGGPGGEPWWLAGPKPKMMLGGSGYTAGQLEAVTTGAGCDADRLLLAGRSGVWGTDDVGGSWHPMVDGLGTTVSHAVEVDPSAGGRVSVGVSDWSHLFSVDGLSTVAMKFPSGSTDTFDIAFDPSTAPSRVVIATGSPSTNIKGEVFSSLDPSTRGWKDEGLSDVAAGKRPLGIATGQTSTGTTVLLAAVDGAGVWRRSGTGAWTKASGAAMAYPQTTLRASFAWPAGSETAYLYDRESGVWRSKDAGRSWSLLWAKPSPFDHTGYVATMPGDPSTLYVSVGGDAVYRIDGAGTGTVGAGLTPVRVSPAENPGPIAIGPGGLIVVAQLAWLAGPPELIASDDGGQTWEVVSDAMYVAAAGFPREVTVSRTGEIYVAINGGGVIKGTPAP